MASVYSYPAGIIPSSTGAHATVTSRLLTDRRVLYVNSAAPNASDSNAGTEREAPFATLSGTGNDGVVNGAYHDASANDIIIVAEDHVEFGGCTINIAKEGLSIFGEGSNDSRPLLKCANAGGGTFIFQISAGGVEIRNFRFIESTGNETNNIGSRLIEVAENGFVLGESDLAVEKYEEAIRIGYGNLAQDCRIENCTFRNVHADVQTGKGPGGLGNYPLSAIRAYALSSSYSSGLLVKGCSFDGGTAGFDDPALWIDGTATDVTLLNNTFTDGADVGADVDATWGGLMAGNTLSASCRVINDSLNEYPLGLVAAGTGGNAILSGPRFIATGSILWVDNTSENSSDVNSGFEEDHPLATLGHAISLTTAFGNQVIVVKPGHSEDLASGLTIANPGVYVFGYGLGNAKPSFRFTGTGAATLLSVSGDHVQVHGLRFPASNPVSGSIQRIVVTGQGCLFEGLDFQAGAHDVATMTITSGDGVTVDNCTFLVTDKGPSTAITTAFSSTPRFSLINNCLFDGGSSVLGWTHGAVKTNSAKQRLTLLGSTFRNGADLVVQKDQLNVIAAGNVFDASSRVQWGS